MIQLIWVNAGVKLKNLIIVISILSAGCVSNSRSEINSIEKEFLTRFLKLAEKEKYTELEDLIIPINVIPSGKSTEKIIYYVKNQHLPEAKEYLGDWSYSHEALRKIIRDYGNDFSNDFDNNHGEEFKKPHIVPEYITKLPNDRFSFLLTNIGFHIVLVKTNEGIKLLFWEGMNSLLKEESK